jgi:5-methylcytosine-specific restriction endonuclease McrA
MTDRPIDPFLKHLKHLREQASLADPALKERVINDDYVGAYVFPDGENRLCVLEEGVVNLTPEDMAERKRRSSRRRSRRRAKERQERVRAGGPRPSADKIANLRKRQNDCCVYCGSQLNGKGHVDHIRPLSRGGTNNIRNLQILCIRCNTLKSARPPTELYSRVNLSKAHNDAEAGYGRRRRDWLDVYKANYKPISHSKK